MLNKATLFSPWIAIFFHNLPYFHSSASDIYFARPWWDLIYPVLKLIFIDNVAIHVLNIWCLPMSDLVFDEIYKRMGIATPCNVANSNNSVGIENASYDTLYYPFVACIARIRIEHA
jgi:hypothetical protein